MLGSSLRRTVGATALLLGLVLNVVASESDDFPNAPGRICATHIPPGKVDAFEDKFSVLKKRQTPVTIRPRSFDIFWTVITANETIQGGWIPKRTMTEQITVLNSDYAEAQISFNLAGYKYVHNRDWFENAGEQSRQERQMKYLFRGGDASVMNLFTIGFKPFTETLGYASMPQWFPNDPVGDGVVVKYTTIPGGSQPYYSTGRTLTHETGHWLGLYHTFEGGCEGNGDYVDDTPAEGEPSRGCPVGKNTCPQRPGEDPIHNFMDYSVDECLTGFTQGQIQRMHEFIENFRQPTNQSMTFPYWGTQIPV